MLNEAIPLIDIISETKDGEWGKGEPFANSCEMIVIRGTDFEKAQIGTIDNIPKRFIPLNIANRKRLRPHDILIETAGGTETNPTGKVVYLSPRLFDNNPFKQFTCASFSRFIRVDNQAANPNYIYWYLRFLYDNRISYMFHVQHTGVARFQWTKFAKSKLIILPPLPIQRRIAAILSAYDELIEVNQQRIRLLEDTARQLYREWFVRMRFPGWKEARMVKGVPEGWEVKPISKAFEIQGGGTPDTDKPEFWDGDINWYSPTDITGSAGIFQMRSGKKITEKGLNGSSAKLFPAYSIMMTSRATIGAVGINTTPACTNQGFITCLPNQDFPYQYLFFWIQQNKENFELLASGSTFLEIIKSTFKKIQIMCPTRIVMDEYVKLADPIFQQIETLQQQNTHLRQIRDRLLPRLVSGKLAVGKLENTP